jgi:glycosyltransferase involved in cell wall biosynthesis
MGRAEVYPMSNKRGSLESYRVWHFLPLLSWASSLSIEPTLDASMGRLDRLLMRLVIAIPVYNEQKYLQGVLEQVKQFHDQILVIDDASSDRTPELLKQVRGIDVLRHSVNQGYGGSLIDAFNWADAQGYDWVITMDCDRQHEPQRIPDFIREIETDKWDLISGSRYLMPEDAGDLPPADRRSINATLTCILNDLFHHSLTDSFCGFKAHRVKPAVDLKLTEKGYAFPMQLWPRAIKAGQRITEIPVRLIYNDPNRHFGGGLDDPNDRLIHYLEVLDQEVRPLVVPAPAVPNPQSGIPEK